MTKRMLIDASHPEETRVVVADGTRIEELDFESSAKRQLRGNVYLARVTRVEPSLQAAFVEYGGNRHGFLAFSEIHPDYYQIPYEDRMALLEAEEADALADAQDEDEAAEKQAKNTNNNSDAPHEADDDDNDDDDNSEQSEPIKKRRRHASRRRYKIQEVIKRGQILLIQVVKEERGNKGAAMTTYLSLAGRYCVLMPNTPRGGGISRKIANGSDRKRLKTIVADLEVPSGIGVIVRTAGAKRTKAEIKRDYEYLSRLWETIREKTLKSIAPSLIHEEGDLVKRSIRDLYDKDISQVLVQGDEAYKDAKTFIKMLMPSHAKNVKAYKDNVPLFLRYDIESQLEDSLSSLVQLKSGGYLVIHPTEALVSIDVNSGRSTKERNVERTALKTNLEAVDEVARQMRLRDLAGLVVIDFIDMDEHKNNRAVERRMKEALSRDRARVQTGRISQFGLMEISRQRRRRSLLDASTISCPHCSGVGRQRSTESTALRALRAAAETGVRGKAEQIRLSVTPDVALYMINEKRQRLHEIEQTYGMFVQLHADNTLLKPDFTIDILKNRDTPITDPMGEIEKEHRQERQDSDRAAAKAKKKEKSKPKDDHDGEAKPAESVDEDENDEDQPRRRRRRGRRGGRRRKGENIENSEVQSTDSSNLDTAEPGADESLDTSEAKPKRGNRRKAPSRNKETPNDEAVNNISADEKPAPKAKTTGRRKAPARKAAKQDKASTNQEHKAGEGQKQDDAAAKPTRKTSLRSTTRRAAPKRKTAEVTQAASETANPPKPRKPTRPVKESVSVETVKSSKTTSRRKAPARKGVDEPTEAAQEKLARKRAAPKRKAADSKASTKTAEKAAPKPRRKPTARKPKPEEKPLGSDAQKPKRTRKAAVKNAPVKAEPETKTPAKAKRKAPVRQANVDAVNETPSASSNIDKAAPKTPKRQSVKIDTPASISPKADVKTAGQNMDDIAKKPKKRSWLKRLTGGDKD